MFIIFLLIKKTCLLLIGTLFLLTLRYYVGKVCGYVVTKGDLVVTGHIKCDRTK